MSRPILVLMTFFSYFYSHTTLAQKGLDTIEYTPQVALELSWNGLCASKVAVYVVQNITAQNKVWTAPFSATAAKVVLKSVKEPLLKACPQIEHIAMFNHGKPQHYLALLKEDWRVKQYRSAELQSSARIQTEDSRFLFVSSDGKQVVGRYGQTPPLSEWVELTGDYIPIVENGKVLGGIIKGNWYAYGQQSERCSNQRLGYAYWGKFSFSIDLEGSITQAKRSVCKLSSHSEIASQGNWFKDIPAKPDTQYFVENGLKAIETQQGLNLFKALNESKDGKLAKEHFLYLHWLGYASSRYLFSVQNTDYFAVKSDLRSNSQGFVAVHKVKDDQVFLNGIEGPNGDISEQFRFTPSQVDIYINEVISRIETMEADADQYISILHYTHNTTLPEVSSMRSKSTAPLVSTTFRKENARWQQRFNSRGANAKFYTLRQGQGLTFNKVYAERFALFIVEQERNRRDRLSNNERVNEDIAAQEKRDEQWKLKAAKQGFVSRSWVYWKQFRFGEDYRAILNGNYDIEQRGGIFPHLLLRFYGQYYISCSDNLPPNAPGYDYYTETTVSDGYFENEYTRFDGSIRIKPEYWLAFNRHHENKPDLGIGQALKDSISARMSGDLLGSARQGMKDMRFYFDLFTALNKDSEMLIVNEGCNSGFVKQLEENFFRLSEGKAPVQSDMPNMNLRQNDNEQLSKGPLFEACFRHNGPNMQASWCSCLDERLSKALSPVQLKKYTTDFSTLSRDIDQIDAPSSIVKPWQLCQS